MVNLLINIALTILVAVWLVAIVAKNPSPGLWLNECALHRPLADCKADYEKLSR